jgi:predicted acyltransferase
VFGRNPLFIYLLSELLLIILSIIPVSPDTSLLSWMYEHIFRYAGDYFGSFLFAVAYMLLCWSVGYWLDKKKIYVKV